MQHIHEHTLGKTDVILLKDALLPGNSVLLLEREHIGQVGYELLGRHVHLSERSAELEVFSEDKCLVVPDVFEHLFDGLHLIRTVRPHRNPHDYRVFLVPEHTVIIEIRRHMTDFVPDERIVEFHIIV